MTTIAATTARTPIAIQAFRLTVIGFLLSSGRVIHKYYDCRTIEIGLACGMPNATEQATVSQGVALRQRVGHRTADRLDDSSTLAYPTWRASPEPGGAAVLQPPVTRGGLWRLAESAALNEKRLSALQ